MAVRIAEVQGVRRRSYPLEARYVCEQLLRAARGGLRLRRGLDVAEAAAPDPGRPADDLALRRLPAASTAARPARPSRSPTGCTPLVARRPARRAARPAARCGSRTTPPTRRTRSRTASSRSPLARARELGFDDARLRLDRQPRQRGRRPRRRARASSPTCSSRPTSRSRRSSRPASTARNLVAVSGNYDDVNRLCTELSGEHDGWAFVNVNMRPTTPRARRRSPTRSPSSSAGSCPTASSPDRLRLAVHEDRQGLRGVARARARRAATVPAMNGAQAAGCSPVAQRLRRRARRLPPGQAGHDRQVAGDRQPGRRPVRARPRARAPAAAIDAVTDDEIRAGIRLLAETTGIFTETAGGVTTAALAKLAERGDIDADERVVRRHHRRGPEDARRRRAARSRRTRSSRRSTAFEAQVAFAAGSA